MRWPFVSGHKGYSCTNWGQSTKRLSSLSQALLEESEADHCVGFCDQQPRHGTGDRTR
ncbi:hypothetical protein J6590_091575, partial [Homalodisca vitripennis]